MSIFYDNPLSKRNKDITRGRLTRSSLLIERLSHPSRCFTLGTQGHYAAVRGVKFLQSTILSGEPPLISVDEIGQLLIWNITKPKNKPVITLTNAHAESINCIAPFPSGLRCVTGSDDKTLRLWDMAECLCVRTFEAHTSFVTCCDVDNTGMIIGSGSLDSTVRLWHLPTQQYVFLLNMSSQPSSVRFLQGHCHLLLTCAPDGVFLWDVRNHHSFVQRISDGVDGGGANTHSEWSATIPPQQPVYHDRLQSSNEARVAKFYDANATVNLSHFDNATQKYKQYFSGHKCPVYSAICTREGGHVITSAFDNKHKLWDVHNQRGLHTYDGCKGTAIPALSSDDRLLVSGSIDGDIFFWHTFAGADEDAHPINPNNSMKVAKTHSAPISAVCFNNDDTSLASADQHGTLCIRTANEDLLYKSMRAKR